MVGSDDTPRRGGSAIPDFAIHAPVTTVLDYRGLDEGEVMCGYLDGLSGAPPPRPGCSRAFWHGWRSGVVDAGHAVQDEDQIALEDAFAALAG